MWIIRLTTTRKLLFSHDLYALSCELLLSTTVCKQLSCDSVKGNSDLFLSILMAAAATHSLIMKEELRIYCQQMERQNNKRRKYVINRIWYNIFRIIPHINPRLPYHPTSYSQLRGLLCEHTVEIHSVFLKTVNTKTCDFCFLTSNC